MVNLKDIKFEFFCDDKSFDQNEKEKILRISETVLNHILESNCYNDVDELDLSRLTLQVNPDEDSIALIEDDSRLPLYPPEKISIWKNLLQF